MSEKLRIQPFFFNHDKSMTTVAVMAVGSSISPSTILALIHQKLFGGLSWNFAQTQSVLTLACLVPRGWILMVIHWLFHQCHQGAIFLCVCVFVFFYTCPVKYLNIYNLYRHAWCPDDEPTDITDPLAFPLVQPWGFFGIKRNSKALQCHNTASQIS